ncbi:MAG: hypothetical protein GY717_06560, partial [Rhodobacteraceae bacterium]|nr:hypothetical protein [Paracoccaceae bacterium]
MSNLVAEKQAFGRGKKGGMGKGGGGSRTPREAPDNLLNDSTLYAIHVVSEGEIGGWADVANPGKCIFFDGTPLQNDDLSFNFEDVSYWLRTGTPDQDPVPGFSAIEAETTLGLKVEQALPVTRQITDADVDAVRVKVGVNALSHLDADTGDVNETRVEYRIEMQVGAGSFTSVVSSAFDGKTTSGYQRAHRIELPDMRPINLRVVRVTADSEQSALQNDIYYVSVTEIIDAKLRYSDTAYVALALPASVFGGSLPTVTFRLRGMLCWVPSNYDPSTRAYDEGTMWDGTFVQAFTDNPAFFGYTVYVEDRWGLGDRIPPALVDKWSVYQIGKYCDGLVDDGLGGTEPRMTINGVINARQAAFEVVTRISSVWRGATFWGAGAVVPVQDAPVDATRLVANANVKGGRFRYSSTGLDARKTVAIAAYRHTDDHYKIKAGAIFEHQAGVRRFGYRDIDMQLPFCASRGEALRTVRWHIDTAMTATQTVSYEAGFDHARIRPFDVVKIADKHKVFTRTMGRLAVVLVNRLGVTLDAAVELVDGESYTVLLTDDLGEIVEAIVTTPATGSTLTLDFASAIPANINPGAVFALNATGVAPREFRVLSNEPKGHLFAITALEHDAGKYARVEDDLQAENTEPFIAPSRGAPLAPASCDVAVFLKPDPGSTSKLRLLASWPGHPDARVVEHRAQVKEPGKPWRWVGGSHEASLEIAPEREVAGLYEVRLFAVTMDGKLSGSYASGSVTHTAADFPRPIPPVPWTAEAGHDMITLVGTTHPASDIRAHRIYGATATDPTLVPLDEIDGTVYPRRPPAGDPYTRYKVTAISYAERESDPDGSPFIAAVPSGVPLADLNQDIVDAIDDAAQSAEADKQAAEQAASDAQAAHGLAETARVASQAARDAGQTAQGLAETARDAAAASESASAGSASAAAGSATTAATEASDAVASATAAAADSVAAETARSGAVAAENAAAASSTSAAGSAASATSSATLSAEIADQASGVLSSQFLEVQ